MLRLARYFLILLVAMGIAFAGAWLADRPGMIRADWGGYRIETSAAAALILLMLFSVVLAGAVIIIRKVRPAALLGLKKSYDRERGYKALSQGLIAIAAGDVASAERLGKRAQRLLPDDGATLVLTAQAAEQRGDRRGAQKALASMMQNSETRLLALRGLMSVAMREGDRDGARTHVAEAYKLNSRSPWVLEAMFTLSCETGHWGAALDALKAQQKQNIIDGPTFRRRRAVVLAAQANQLEQDGDAQSTITSAQNAFRLAPDLSDNAIRLVNQLVEDRQKRKARKTLDQALQAFPHPDLVALDRDLMRDEKPGQRFKRIEKLLGGNIVGATAQREALLARVDAAVAGGLKSQAAELLKTLPAGDRTARAWRLLEGLARAEGDADKAREAMLHAAAAPRDPEWVCRSCARHSSTWDAVCPACHAIDSQDWRAGERGHLGPAEAAAAATVEASSAKPAKRRTSLVDVTYDVPDDEDSQEVDRQKVDPEDPQSMARQTP